MAQYSDMSRDEKVKAFIEATDILLSDVDGMEHGDPAYLALGGLLFAALCAQAGDTYMAIFDKGPLYDGEVPSKSERNLLLELRLAAQVVCKGEEGHTAITYRGATPYHAAKSFNELSEEKQNEAIQALRDFLSVAPSVEDVVMSYGIALIKWLLDGNQLDGKGGNHAG